MIYIDNIKFPNSDAETDFIWSIKKTCYNSFYPFKILSANGLEQIDFEPITILYGGNGSGKSTALNVIAEKTRVKRESIFNKSNFFADFVNMCTTSIRTEITENSQIITSDDVFDYMLNIRNLNEGIDRKREEVFGDYLNVKYSKFQLQSIEDYEQLKKMNNSRSKTQSRFVRDELMDNVREYSNGESAFKYFTEKIHENGLYILDEPENSLSPKRQLELAEFIVNSVRFFKCQIIMSTHSPFFLATKGAKIYNLDENPVSIRHWTELENIRIYYEFFKSHNGEF